MIEDIKDLNLPDIYTGDLQSILVNNRMLWEVWLESANSFNEFYEKLRLKGYSNIPYVCKPSHQVRPNKIVKTMTEGQPIIPKIRNMQPKPTMVQRKST